MVAMKREIEINKRSDCPVANSLDLIGDRWTLLIARDLFKGKKRYKEFLESEEKIPTNILANRLKTMEETGMIERRIYSERPPRYEYTLTEEGEKLGEIVLMLYKWGNKNLLKTNNPDELPSFLR
jgi:DNA-binding HxlR family transcriptional regulator